MKKLLMRGGMSPFDNIPFGEAIRQNSILTNTGNLMFQHGLYRTLLTEDTVIDMDYYNISKDNYTDEEIARINEEYDAYVCPLANAFRESFTSGLVRVANLFDRLTIPCYVVGVCLQAPYEPDITAPRKFDAAAKQFVAAALNKSAIIGVRGEITGDYLKHLGFKEGKDYVPIGCPSMFTMGDTLPTPHTEISKDSKISFNYHFRTSKNLVEFIFREIGNYENHYIVAQNYGELNLLYCGRSLPEIYTAYHKSELPPRDITHPLLAEDRYRVFINTAAWISFLRGMDLSIGSRFHGNVAAVLAGCPALFIPSDSRVRELTAYHKLPAVSYQELTSDTTIEGLIDRVDMCSHLATHAANFHHFLDFLDQNQLNHIYKGAPGRREAPLDAQTASIPYQKAESVLRCNPQELACRIDTLQKSVKNDKFACKRRLAEYLGDMNASLFKSFQAVLLYGAGAQGKACLKLLRDLGIQVTGFVISDDQPETGCVGGLPVYLYSELPFCREDVLIIQAANSKEIERRLEESAFHWMKLPKHFWKLAMDKERLPDQI